ncbi:MAG: O-antigen ligase family protein [Paenibacillus sp.]|uniref:O-antigen ligase family protein n=1 Tax=Paenibacillus sp. TaxID=58172 RepID=UPI0025EA3599|nr:O-antigen ligase family protein [Paenibacillus sp.]MBR2567154.1 O-antigen ligase family protein [Paenibacillus sp.]
MQKTGLMAAMDMKSFKIIFLSLVIVAAAIYLPLVSVAALLSVILLGVYIRRPSWIFMILVISFSLSIDKIFRVQLAGLDSLSFYKLAILGFVVSLFLRYGIRKALIYPALAIMFLFLESYFLSDLPNKVSPVDPFKAFLGVVVPFLLLIPHFSREVSQRIIHVLAWLPLFSLAGGYFLQMGGILSIVNLEISGVTRLQGANIAAHLAMLCFISICVCLIQIRQGQQAVLFYMLTLTHLVILVQTGTRGPLIALIPIILVYLFDQLKAFVKGRVIAVIPLILFVVAVAYMVIAQWDNYEMRSESKGLSGRDVAWSYFIEKANEYPIFGRGLGSTLVANDGSIFSGFVVPHNEYIRFYYDGGLVGAILLFLSLLLVFGAVYHRLKGIIKLYFVGMIAGFLIYSFFDNTLSTVHLIAPFCIYLNALYTTGEAQNTTKTSEKEADPQVQLTGEVSFSKEIRT